MDWLKKHINDLILFFIFVGIVSLFNEGLMTPKTISGIALYFLLIYKHLILKQPLSHFNKKIAFLILLFFLSLFVSAIFSEKPLYSFHWIKRSYWVSIPIGLAIISVRTHRYFYNILWYAFLSAGTYCNLHFFLKTIKASHTFNLFSPNFVPDRNYTFYIGMLFPFFISGIFVFRNFWLKLSCIFNVILTFCLLIPIGSRGAYGTVGIEIILLLSFAGYTFWKKGYRKPIALVTILMLFSLTGLILKYHSHPKVIGALKRGLSPNGRDVIINDRLFLILKERPLVGIGYGRQLYFDFLDKHHVRKRFGEWDPKEKRFVYYSDEGLFLQTIIRQGVLGFTIFLILYLLCIKKSLSRIFNTKNIALRLFYLCIFSIFIGHYFFRGLVETLSLTQFFVFAFLL